ncbi:sulfatase-like hydrolase/transferase [bacterium]|nr:sulfatase-like hydrolase/transferase [bacterium]
MDKPNILIVMTDHQRADTVLSDHPAITPNLDRLGREGVTFTSTFCPSPHCCPARATFFSSLYPSRHGVWNNICNGQALSTGLKDGVRLWSEDLQEAGYNLYYTGKWHVSIEEGPEDRGWRTRGATAGKGAFHGVAWDRYEKIAREEDPAAPRGEGEVIRPGYGNYTLYGTGSDSGNAHDEKVLADALETLPKLAQGDEPWCLYVGFIAPHDPYMVPKKYLDMYNVDDIPLPENYADEMSDKPAVYQRMRKTRFGQLSEREIREGIRHFWAYCTYLDDLFGRILDQLDRTGQRDNTLVLYCSDHGDYCGEHGLFAKGIPCFQGAYHVPAVVRWPQGVKNPGRQVDEFVSLADFGPTFLDVAACPADRHFVGASLTPFLKDQKPSEWRDDIHTQCNGVELYYTQRSVMTKDFKYVFNGFDWDELYDLKNDPHEMNNLAQNPECDDIIREMCGRLWRFAQREDDSVTNPYITVGLAPYGPGQAFKKD